MNLFGFVGNKVNNLPASSIHFDFFHGNSVTVSGITKSNNSGFDIVVKGSVVGVISIFAVIDGFTGSINTFVISFTPPLR